MSLNGGSGGGSGGNGCDCNCCDCSGCCTTSGMSNTGWYCCLFSNNSGPSCTSGGNYRAKKPVDQEMEYGAKKEEKDSKKVPLLKNDHLRDPNAGYDKLAQQQPSAPSEDHVKRLSA